MRRASFLSRYCSTSKSLTSPAKVVSWSVASKRVIGPMPDRPSTMPCQVDATSLPSGVISPMPVMTTRRSKKRLLVGPIIGAPERPKPALPLAQDDHVLGAHPRAEPAAHDRELALRVVQGA